MNTALAVLALLVSLLALALVLRGRRVPEPPPPHAPPPPPPPPPPPEDRAARARLTALEARFEEVAAALGTWDERASRLEGGWRAEADTLRRALASLEAALDRLREAHEQLAAEPDEEAAEEAPVELAPDACVRAYLHAEGWEEIALLPDGEHVWRVEARRSGGVAKGRARLFPDGRVEARLVSPTRAFP